MQTDATGSEKTLQKPDKRPLSHECPAGVQGSITARRDRLPVLDLMIVETGKLPEVKNILIHPSLRGYGPSGPVERVTVLEPGSLRDGSRRPEKIRIGAPGKDAILLSDHILNKKVLDTEDAEVEVVYDIRLVERNKKPVCH